MSAAAVRPRYDSQVRTRHFAVCVRNRGYRASLDLRKLYPVLPDAFADEHQMIRVIDESGEEETWLSETEWLLEFDFFLADSMGFVPVKFCLADRTIR